MTRTWTLVAVAFGTALAAVATLVVLPREPDDEGQLRETLVPIESTPRLAALAAPENSPGEENVAGEDNTWAAGNPSRANDASNSEPTPLLFPNNANTILQRDSFGISQNIAYYDGDSGLFLGPGSDPRTTIYANVPLNLFRRHVVLDFEEAQGFDPRCELKTSGAANVRSEMGFLLLSTGVEQGSRAELSLPQVSAPAYAGQRVYFYLRTYPGGNLNLRFGLQQPGDLAVCVGFTRADTGGPHSPGGSYFALTQTGPGDAARTDTQTGGGEPGGDSVRRLFCLNITQTSNALHKQQGEVEFYVGTVGGTLERKAVHTTHIPDVNTPEGRTRHLVPFVEIENTAPVSQQVAVDVLYAVLLR